MSASSDRARFFLEQALPELQELLDLRLFTQEEISAITKTRSNFEHTLNSRECKIVDYVRYLAYEQTLEKLKLKRIKRAGIRKITHNGPRKILPLFERATRKFPGDLQLWVLYLKYARFIKAYKRLGKILTTLLRLQPSNPDLWIIAARYSAHIQDDLRTARGYIQRGLRFCPQHQELYVELVHVEMLFVRKAFAEIQSFGMRIARQDENGITQLGESSADERALSQMSKTPVLSGSMVRAIFNLAMAKFDHDERLAREIYEQVTQFPGLSCSESILTSITHHLLSHHPKSPNTALCMFELKLSKANVTSASFPRALEEAVEYIYPILEGLSQESEEILIRTSRLISGLTKAEIPDPEVYKVLSTLQSHVLSVQSKYNGVGQLSIDVEMEGSNGHA